MLAVDKEMRCTRQSFHVHAQSSLIQ